MPSSPPSKPRRNIPKRKSCTCDAKIGAATRGTLRWHAQRSANDCAERVLTLNAARRRVRGPLRRARTEGASGRAQFSALRLRPPTLEVSYPRAGAPVVVAPAQLDLTVGDTPGGGMIAACRAPPGAQRRYWAH